MNLRDRIEAAVQRAAGKYCNRLTATTADGTTVDLFAVKRVADVEEVAASVSSRLFEFILSPSSADALLAAVGGSAIDKKLAELRKVTLKEYVNAAQVAEYKINGTRPLCDDAPSGGPLRLFAYLVKG